MSIPQSPRDITEDWLSRVLSRQSTSPVRVKKVEIEAGTQWNVAETAFINVHYGTTTTALPRKLFIKTRLEPDPLGTIFPGEHEFYTTTDNPTLPVAPCVASLRDATTGATCLLLEDLSVTHEPSQWPIPPTVSRCFMAVQSMAEVHAYWHQSRSDNYLSREKALNQIVLEMLPNFFDELGDRLSAERADLLRQVCLQIPSLKAARYHHGKPFTRIHGDAHFWNVLYPRDPKNNTAILIDFEDWRVDFAGLDLAMMMALHWYPQRRALHEVNMLEQYLLTYNACNVTKLSWEELWLDYRLGHVCNAVVPIFQHAANQNHAGWWSHLERWFLSFDDLACWDFL